MQQRNRIWRGGIWAGLVVCLLLSNAGCTRLFYRNQADREVSGILSEKDVFPGWKIEQMTPSAYPDPRARFADPTDPDHPPMPPDDPSARLLGPNPQGPRHAGTGRVSGTGYLDLLAMWDAQNRSDWAANGRGENALSMAQAIRTVALRQKDGDSKELLPPPRPVDEMSAVKTNPYLIRIEQAMELGLINSREFQARREDLYLTALPVTRERFAFSAQWLAIGQYLRERSADNGPLGPGQHGSYGSGIGFSKLFSTGALLLFSFANQTVINLGNPAGAPYVNSASTINLDFVQPLLRGGGKAVTLEPLTLTERNLLYEIRNYARFRKQYFQYMTGGALLPFPPGSVTAAGSLASSHPLQAAAANSNIARQQVVPSGLGSVGGATTSGTLFLGINPIAPDEGFLYSLYKAGVLKYEVANVNALKDVLKLFEAYETGGQVSSLQVGQVQLQLLQSQSTVLQAEQTLRDSLDNFKQQLGIPIHLQIELDDTTVRPITDQLSRYNAVIKDYEATIQELDKLDGIDMAGKVRASFAELLKDSKLTTPTKTFRVNVPEHWERWRKMADVKSIQDQLGKYNAELRKLYDRKSELEKTEQSLNPTEQSRLQTLEMEISLADLELVMRRYEKAPWQKLPTERAKRDEQAGRWRDLRNAFVLILGAASNERFANLRPQWAPPAPVIVNGVNLIDADVEKAYAIVAETALDNRLDLMNTRGQVVDAWRQVRVFANSLLGTFNVSYHMDSSTPPNGNQPLAFQSNLTRHQLGMNFELPLVRVTERNAYRACLIAYQRSRRDLDQKEDEIVNNVRSEVRQLQVFAKNLKIQQQAVELAYQQVESSLETFRAPQSPSEGGNAAANAFSLTQQLLQAYSRLPTAQETLLKTWIDYHVMRQLLFLDMELMPLDARGVWLDEFNHSTGNLSPQPERPTQQTSEVRTSRGAVRYAP